MAIKRTSTLPLLGKNFNFDISIEKKLRYIGEKGVEFAIHNHEFGNVTHNLEDSYGYAVYKYGNIQGSPFVTNPKATTPKVKGEISYSGNSEAINFLQSYKPHPEGWTLVVVAGMFYASFLEFYHMLDVLQDSEAYAENLANAVFRNAQWFKLK